MNFVIIPYGYEPLNPFDLLKIEVSSLNSKQDNVYIRLVTSFNYNLYSYFSGDCRKFTYNGYELDPQKDLQCLKGII